MNPWIQWLIDYMDNAEHQGALLTVGRIISLEKAEGHEYTKCSETMAMLRKKYKENEVRIEKDIAREASETSGTADARTVQANDRIGVQSSS